jgi:hypothetical protein
VNIDGRFEDAENEIPDDSVTFSDNQSDDPFEDPDKKVALIKNDNESTKEQIEGPAFEALRKLTNEFDLTFQDIKDKEELQ